MMEPTAALVASISLLVTPGPTNTLLATSGAALGVRRSLPLLAAELCGYMIAIIALRAFIGPLVSASPTFGIALRIVVAIYLAYLSAKLWRHGASNIRCSDPVAFRQVLLTTLLNPKGIIFAFTILPQNLATMGLLPWLAALAFQIAAIGVAWIGAGALLRNGLGSVVPSNFGYRLSAIALALLAGAVSAHAFR